MKHSSQSNRRPGRLLPGRARFMAISRRAAALALGAALACGGWAGAVDETYTCPDCGATITVHGTMDVADIAEASLPSIVSITNISVQQAQDYFDRFGRFGHNRSELQETTSVGSGIIFEQTDDTLYIVTNYHVIEGATTLSAGFADGEVYEAQLCGTDEAQDLAVIQVSADELTADTLNAIAVAPVGDSDALRVGEQVVAIGNALGYGQSVTTGIVSALNRSVGTGTDSSGNTVYATYIQTDAAINPGNSGGALLNMDGELIGINTAKQASTEVEGMGYAIPISDVWETIQALKTQSPAQNGAQQLDYRRPFSS